MIAYHDEEWGVPLHDERRLFELLCLEGAQAGLSWKRILDRRDGYREVYDDFDAGKMAAYDDARQARLLADRRIIRNRAKVRAFRDNARAVLELREHDGGLDPYLWGFVGGEPVVNHFEFDRRAPRADATGGRDLGGSQAARVSLRGTGHRLCLPAVRWPRERPSRELLPAS